jgi:hypothetical protein
MVVVRIVLDGQTVRLVQTADRTLYEAEDGLVVEPCNPSRQGTTSFCCKLQEYWVGLGGAHEVWDASHEEMKDRIGLGVCSDN